MKYYAMLDGEQKGPFELNQLPEMGVRPSTYIWCDGMKDWEKAEDVAEVCRLYRNRLYDIMHPQFNSAYEDKNDSKPGSKINLSKNNAEININNTSPTRFDRILNKEAHPPLPTIEEIDDRENTDLPPASMIMYAWIVTFLCFPPTGIAALIFAYKSRDAWKNGNNKEAHEYSRTSKMWTGISFFMGLIVYAALIRFL